MANDCNTQLVTGNDFVGVSRDDGRSFQPADFIDPNAFDSATNAPPGDFYCCDQTATTIDRGGSSLFVWTMLTADTSSHDGDGKGVNSVRIVVFRNPNDLLAHISDPTTSCSWSFTAKQLVGLSDDRSIDRPQASATDKFLLPLYDGDVPQGEQEGRGQERRSRDLADADLRP